MPLRRATADILLLVCLLCCTHACMCLCVCLFVLLILSVGSTEATDMKAVVICTRASLAVCEVCGVVFSVHT